MNNADMTSPGDGLYINELGDFNVVVTMSKETFRKLTGAVNIMEGKILRVVKQEKEK